MKQIVVTGSKGFIGKKLMEKLNELDFDVIEINSENGGITNLDLLKRINYDNVIHIFHLAGKTFVPDSWINPKDYYNVNAMGTLNVLEICREKKISLTFVSSYIYGEPESLPISENHRLNPNNPYSHSKYMAEQFCEFYAKEFNVNTTVIRPFNVYGIGQDVKFLIPHIIRQALFEQEIQVKDLSPKRDFVFLDDLVDALILTINDKRGYSVYNIGSGDSISVKKIIDIVQQVLKTNKRIICESDTRKNEISDVVANINKANVELNWFPKYSFINGVKQIIYGEESNEIIKIRSVL